MTKPDRREVSTIGTPGVAPDVAQIIQLLTGAEMALAQQWTDSLEDMDAALTDRCGSACNHVRRALAALSRDSLG